MASATSPTKGPYPQLRAFARAQGIPYDGALQLQCSAGSAPVTLSLLLNSGTVYGVSVEVAAGAWPSVELRPESDDDRASKAGGVAVEFQTGDAAFDPRVYVDAPEDEDAPRAMLTAPVRAAALELFALGARSIVWNSLGLSTQVHADARGEVFYDAANLDRIVRSSLTLAAAPRPSGPRRAPPARGFVTAVGLFAALSFAGMLVAMVRWTPESSWACFAAAVSGLLGFVPFRLVAARVLRGGSSSHQRLFIASAFAFLGLPMASLAALATLNGALDAAPPSVTRGRILSVGAYDSEDSSYPTTVRWEGSTLDVTVDVPSDPRPSAGAVLEHVVHPGALGLAWGDRYALSAQR